MNYIDKVASEISEVLNSSWHHPESRILLWCYALLCLTKGEATTCQDVHDAWSAWATQVVPSHRSLVPFKDLSPAVQELDRPYRDAIREVAKRRAKEGKSR